jgi:hypothetical protein
MSTSHRIQPTPSVPQVLSVGAAVALVITLSGCVGAEPTPTETVAETPESSSPAPTAESAPSSTLPACDSIFTPAGFALVSSENLQWTDVASGSESDPGLALFDSSLEPALIDNESISCSFILPASERGMSVYAILMSDSDTAIVVSFFTGAGYTVSAPATGAGTIYSIVDEGEYPFTEAHLVRDDILVSSFDSFGLKATDYVADASAQIATLTTP